MAWLKRLLIWLATWLVGLVLLFEEWGWEHLAAAMAWLGRWPGLRHLEALIRRLPPYAALAMFAAPVLALLPVKLLALYWISQGHAALGVLVIVSAKLLGTAVLARLFGLTQPALMRLAWFARLFRRWMTFKTRVLADVRASRAWRSWLRARQQVRRAIDRAAAWVRRHWR